jgi:3'-phosphoadenosine 5'-phosphosulfate sulfotransferase (PAPS reductase)/FAD synthetase
LKYSQVAELCPDYKIVIENMEKNLLVSFSGGETSAFMGQWLNNHYEELGYENIVFVFANTGLENEQTLEFVNRCDKHFKLGIEWIEADVIHEYKKGTRYYRTDFDSANRNGDPFEQFISKYGIPNQANPQCTRELKAAPISSFGKDWFNGEKYHTAIGIRRDEADRMNAKYKEMRLIYPLISENMIPATKPMINFYWRSMPFRLELKGYQGNCATCWKKSDKKLYQIAQENPKAFDFMDRMEEKYGNFFPPQRIEKWIKEGKETPKNITFFRNKRSSKQILEEAKDWKGTIKNDADEYSYQTDLLGGDSCEVFSECGA